MLDDDQRTAQELAQIINEGLQSQPPASDPKSDADSSANSAHQACLSGSDVSASVAETTGPSDTEAAMKGFAAVKRRFRSKQAQRDLPALVETKESPASLPRIRSPPPGADASEADKYSTRSVASMFSVDSGETQHEDHEVSGGRRQSKPRPSQHAGITMMRNKWQARAKGKYLGTFDTEELALEAKVRHIATIQQEGQASAYDSANSQLLGDVAEIVEDSSDAQVFQVPGPQDTHE